MPADEVGVLIGLEVREPHDDLIGVEGSPDPANTHGEAVDEELLLAALVGSSELIDSGNNLTGCGVTAPLEFLVVDEGQGVDADVGVDDELLPGKANSIIGDLGVPEGILRDAHIHHDLGPGRGDLIEVEALNGEVKEPLIDRAHIPFSTGDSDGLSGGEPLGCVLGADDTGDPQLPGDDGSMAGAASLVGDNGSCHLHDGLPVRVCHGGHQDLTPLKLTDVGGILDDVGSPLADLAAHCLTGEQHSPCLPEHVGLNGPLALQGVHSLRACLHNEELTPLPVLCPLDVHGLLVVILDDTGPPGKG